MRNNNWAFNELCVFIADLSCSNCPLENYDACARYEKRLIANYTDNYILKQQMARCYYNKCYLCKNKTTKNHNCSGFLLHKYFKIYKDYENT